VRLQGDRVVVRDLLPRDVGPFVAAYVDDPPVAAKPPTPAEVRAMLRLEERNRESGERLQLALAEPEHDAWIGSLTLHSFDWRERRAEVGFWVARAWRRRGIAVEAVQLVDSWAMTTLRLTRIDLRTTPDNEAAQRVAERAGFQRSGRAEFAWLA
jgi:[ribosomal protein S5]-alanine N-acetyltransferase